MARAKKSTQPAPDLTEQEQAKAHYTQEVIEEQCQIRMPGKWLESKLTDAEVTDIVKLQETIEKYKDNTSDEKKLDLCQETILPKNSADCSGSQRIPGQIA